MTRREVVLAALAAGDGASYSPVQIQKMLFLLDKNVAKALRSPHFHFKPYNYGPFDSAVYGEIEVLARENLAVIQPHLTWCLYVPTESGLKQGKKLLKELPK